MKRRIFALTVLFSTLLISSCSKDDDPKQEDPNVNHVGEKWNITSATYTIIDQKFNPVSQILTTGTKSNIGAFYFDGSNGSFEFDIDKIHKEDIFTFTDNSGQVSIVNITQNVGTGSVSQYVISLSGSKTTTTMSLSGTIIKQTTTSQSTMTGEFTLTKQ
jgi:hypothetical protein